MTLTAALPFNLFSDPKIAANLGDMAGRFAVNFLIALVILAITIWLSRLLSRLMKRGMARLHPLGEVDSTLDNFISSLIRYGVLIVGLIAVFAQLGLQTTSILAVLGAASLAIGLALQGTLGNVAAGVMLLMLRPYRVGDYVELAGRTGTVLALDLFVTTLDAADGLRLTIPNGKIFGEVIANYTTSGKRRVELTFGVEYQDDLDRGIAALLACAGEDKRVLKTPEPWAKVTALEDSAVVLTLRFWVANRNYVDAGPDMRKAAKAALEAAGLGFAYPHQVGLTGAPAKGPATGRGFAKP